MSKPCYNGLIPPDDNVKYGWKPLIDTTKGSSELSDAVAKLPNGHNWGHVCINESSGIANCIKCGLEIAYNSNKKWVPISVAGDSTLLFVMPKECNEVIMEQALK